MFNDLIYRKVKTIIGQYDTEGHAPLKVLTDDFNPYVLKFPKNSFDNAPAQKKILNPNDILKIALFDLWVENEDRRPTNNNILLSPSNKGFVLNPIDHAFTFSTLGFSELTYSTVNFSDNDSILYAPLAESIIKKLGYKADFRTELQEMFYLCIENAKLFFPRIVSNIPENLEFTDNDKLKLSEFLFNKDRNILVWQEFIYIINSILK